MQLYAPTLLKSTGMMQRPINGSRLTMASQLSNQIKPLFAAAHRNIDRSRLGRALLAGARATAHSFGQVLHRLWLEVTGFTFLAIAVMGAAAGMREYGKYQAGHGAGAGRLLLAICFTASFAWFGLTSFWRVSKRTSRQRIDR